MWINIIEWHDMYPHTNTHYTHVFVMSVLDKSKEWCFTHGLVKYRTWNIPHERQALGCLSIWRYFLFSRVWEPWCNTETLVQALVNIWGLELQSLQIVLVLLSRFKSREIHEEFNSAECISPQNNPLPLPLPCRPGGGSGRSPEAAVYP